MANQTKYDKNYFVFPNPFWAVIILFGLWLLGITAFNPDKVPAFLGPLGDFARYLGKNYPYVCVCLCIFAVVTHCLEAAYAEKLCIDKRLSFGTSVKWTSQTLIFGYASLYKLKQCPSAKKIS